MSRMVQAIASNIDACILCTPGQFVVNSLIATGPTPMSATQKYFRYAVITALKTEAGGANTGIVNIGAKVAANSQPIPLNPGDSYVIQAAVGAKFNFQDWYFLVATDGDGLVAIYS